MKIIHVFRAPVGGLFRHVRDLARAQAESGHEVGLICDTGGGGNARKLLDELSPHLALGVLRLPMPRLPAVADVRALRAIGGHVARTAPAIVHGHGAKGGLYARLAKGRAKAVYTAHGGSLHYSWKSPGALFLAAERLLLKRTDGQIFVCEFERDAFRDKIGLGDCPSAVIHNGLAEEEFAPVAVNADAADILFIGELRRLKGVDVLIEAIARLRRAGRPLRAVIVGDGPDREAFAAQVKEAGLGEAVEMPGAMPAAAAFPLGRVMVVPSRAESFPYVVLEAQAAGKPVIASDVGGIGEMLEREYLVPAGDAEALAARLAAVLDDEEADRRALERMEPLKERFSAAVMARSIVDFYRSLP